MVKEGTAGGDTTCTLEIQPVWTWVLTVLFYVISLAVVGVAMVLDDGGRNWLKIMGGCLAGLIVIGFIVSLLDIPLYPFIIAIILASVAIILLAVILILTFFVLTTDDA